MFILFPEHMATVTVRASPSSTLTKRPIGRTRQDILFQPAIIVVSETEMRLSRTLLSSGAVTHSPREILTSVDMSNDHS